MNFVAIISAILNIAMFFIDRAKKANALDEAKSLVLAAQIVKLAEKAGVLKNVEVRIAAMSDDTVVDELSKRGDFRD